MAGPLFVWQDEVDPIDLRDTVRKLLEPTIARAGFDLVAVEWLGGRRGAVLRLSIEGAGEEGPGVTADDCARVSERVSPLLDEADPIPGRYTLEVSSPGIARPVQRVADFVRFTGYRVKIRLVEGPPRRRYTGVIRGVDEHDLLVDVDGAEHRLSLDTIERAHLDLTIDEYQNLAPSHAENQS